MIQPIFYNHLFTINGKCISHGSSEWIANGIFRVSGIVNTDRAFCSKNSLQTKHGLIVSDLLFNQIKSVLNTKVFIKKCFRLFSIVKFTRTVLH